jgi:hypothetical protein
VDTHEKNVMEDAEEEVWTRKHTTCRNGRRVAKHGEEKSLNLVKRNCKTS